MSDARAVEKQASTPMAVGDVALAATADVSRIEAPITVKAYLMCAFASFGGIFFGYDIGYISSVTGMDYFIHLYTGIPVPGPGASSAERVAFTLTAWEKSLITCILSAGTFFWSARSRRFCRMVCSMSLCVWHILGWSRAPKRSA
jgi:hypothetical protein